MDREAWQATTRGGSKSWTQLSPSQQWRGGSGTVLFEAPCRLHTMRMRVPEGSREDKVSVPSAPTLPWKILSATPHEAVLPDPSALSLV